MQGCFCTKLSRVGGVSSGERQATHHIHMLLPANSLLILSVIEIFDPFAECLTRLTHLGNPVPAVHHFNIEVVFVFFLAGAFCKTRLLFSSLHLETETFSFVLTAGNGPEVSQIVLSAVLSRFQ